AVPAARGAPHSPPARPGPAPGGPLRPLRRPRGRAAVGRAAPELAGRLPARGGQFGPAVRFGRRAHDGGLVGEAGRPLLGHGYRRWAPSSWLCSSSVRVRITPVSSAVSVASVGRKTTRRVSDRCPSGTHDPRYSST